MHHVFEHFERFNACAYVASWNSWLIKGGVLDIEVPDFEQTLKKNLNYFSGKHYQDIALRHIFGSQEAPWAVHYEGYSEKKLLALLGLFGFGNFQIKSNNHNRTYNIEVIAHKIKSITADEALQSAKQYLKGYLVDDSETEKRLLNVWIEKYLNQINQSIAK